MAFHLPSAASRGVVSILNSNDDHKGASQQKLQPPSSRTSSGSTSTAPSPMGADSGGSYSSSVFTAGSANTATHTDATSIEPSPRSQPSSWSSSKTSQLSSWGSLKTPADENPSFFDDKARSIPRLIASPGPMSERNRPAGLDEGYLATDTYPVSDVGQLRHRQMSSAYDPMRPMMQGAAGAGHQPSSDSPSTADSLTSTAHKRPKPSVVHGKKRYPCSHPGCDKTFSTSGHAARHNRIHTGQKPYRCTYEGCKASFSRQDNALAHYRTGHALAKAREGDDSDISVDSLRRTQDGSVDSGAELGRRALEQGTAIAVVRDGKVERTVGLPKGRRSASSSKATSVDFPDCQETTSSRTGPIPASEYAQSRRDSASRGTSPPRKHLIEQRLFADNKPSSVHSDYEHRTHLPTFASAASSLRMHPYHQALPRQRTSIENASDEGRGGRYTVSDAGIEADASRGIADLRHHPQNSGLLSARRGSASQFSRPVHPHLLPGTLTSGARQTAPSSQPTASSVGRGSWSSGRVEALPGAFARSRQVSATGRYPPSSSLGGGCSAPTLRGGSPEALLTLSNLSRSSLPCSSDRTTSASGPTPHRYQAASPLDAGDGPIRLPPLNLRSPS